MVFRTEEDDKPVAIPNRRRLGRITDLSPHLIPLLRRPPALAVSDTKLKNEISAVISAAELDSDNLKEARGLALSVAIGVAFWAILFVCLWLLFRH